MSGRPVTEYCQLCVVALTETPKVHLNEKQSQAHYSGGAHMKKLAIAASWGMSLSHLLSLTLSLSLHLSLSLFRSTSVFLFLSPLALLL